MTTDRALELAETALHEKRSHAKHSGQPMVERECEEALLLLSDIRSRMLSNHLRRASEGLREADERQPTALPSETLRTAENG